MTCTAQGSNSDGEKERSRTERETDRKNDIRGVNEGLEKSLKSKSSQDLAARSTPSGVRGANAPFQKESN